MKFYYCNNMGDRGYFSERNLVKAIYAAWNIEADLYLVEHKEEKLVFAPFESNEVNTDLLKEFGYHIEDVDDEREIIELKTGKVIKYEWSEVKQLN